MSYFDQFLKADAKQEIDESPTYKFEDWLESGKYGAVCKVSCTSTQQIYAIKCLNLQHLWCQLDRQKTQKRTLRELINLKNLTGHPLIIEFKEVFMGRKFLFLVMEFAEGGNLRNYIVSQRKLKGPLSESDARRFFQQLIVAVKFCHKFNIANRDIKLDNILLARDPTGDINGWWKSSESLEWHLKLCDFGYSKDILQSTDKSNIGTKAFCPPEVLYLEPNQVINGMKRDVWSCGIVLYILLTGYLPFNSEHYICPEDFFKAVKAAKFARGNIADEPFSLLQVMLQPDPELRWPLDDIVCHSWFMQDLPLNWNENFEQLLQEKQAGLQSDGEIQVLVDRVFSDTRDLEEQFESFGSIVSNIG
eukprot:TRINITY_DN4094_c0_g1_i1.p2 TRINITY_DN4094_c0_g1~~TRINITY_DN4094_c0_g1_i1.p2  ORF type:complete len:405 (-),score=26.91 TRINITY_DN4094_c0_g1_i1:144-1229(-)